MEGCSSIGAIGNEECDMKMYVFEGTPDEIGAVMKTMGPITGASLAMPLTESKSRPPLPLTPPTGAGDNDEEKMEFVTVEFARAAMTRIALSDPLKNVLIALRDADPEWVSVADLYEASGYTSQQFAGLMGAFGRRMKYTEGFREDAHFFDFEWDEETSAWSYRLPDSVIEAMRLEGIA